MSSFFLRPAVAVQSLFFHLRLAGVFKERGGQMAVACGILVEIVLMVFLGGIEVFQGFQFHDNQVIDAPLHLVEYFPDDGQVGCICIVDAGPILRTLVVSLPVE